MKAINVFLLCTGGFAILNIAGKLLLNIEPLSIELTATLGFAVTWCIFKDEKTNIKQD